MLLRITRGRVLPGREEHFIAISRQQVEQGARSPGLLAFMGGYRRIEGTDEFILVSSWLDDESVVRSVGDRPIEQPRSSDVLADVATIEQVDHYTMLEPIHRGMLDAPGAVLRYATATLQPGRLPDLLRWMKEKDREINATRILLGWALGHRVERGREVVASVSAWASPLQIEAVAEEGRAAGGALFAAVEQFVTDISVANYQAIELKLPAALADLGGRRLIAARFSSAEAAAEAKATLEQRFESAREAGVFTARLGSAGHQGEQLVLVARITLAEHAHAQRQIVDLGGQVLYETDEARAEGSAPARIGPMAGGIQPL
jgi:hypothetical protein